MSNQDSPHPKVESVHKAKRFKTMEIHAMPKPFYPTVPAPTYKYPANSYQQYYNPTFALLISILCKEGNKKFSQNEVLQIKMTELDKYTDHSKIKLLYRSSKR